MQIKRKHHEVYDLDPYDMWAKMPKSWRECIPAPASRSYAKAIPPGEGQQKLIAMLAMLGAKEIDDELVADDQGGGGVVWKMVDDDYITVISSTERLLKDNRNKAVAWVYLPAVLRLVFPELADEIQPDVSMLATEVGTR